MLAFTRNPAGRLSSNPIRRFFSRSFFLPPAPAAVVRLIAIAAIVWASSADTPAAFFPKLDPLLSNALLAGQSNVVVMAADPASVDGVAQLIQWLGGQPGRRLPVIDGLSATLPNASIAVLAGSDLVKHIALDRVILGAMERTGATVGATAVRDQLGVDGSGVVVAVVDSGIAPATDDLADGISGSLRADRFVDFVNGGDTPYDDYGHGTHVAGIIAGNGFDSSGARSGIAPGARLVVLKALDQSGQGQISNVIAAIDYAVEHRSELNIRLLNLSIGAGVYE